MVWGVDFLKAGTGVSEDNLTDDTALECWEFSGAWAKLLQ